MSMTVFFDCEFTRFRDLDHEPKLISIGCVAQDGREFYAELLDTWQVSDCSQFVLCVVLPLLDNEKFLQEAQIAVRLKDWIEGLSEQEVVMRSDAPGYDWPLVAELFQFYGCWPKNLRRKCGTIYFGLPRQEHRYAAGLAAYWKDNIDRQHHALVDARSLQFAWKYAIRRGI